MNITRHPDREPRNAMESNALRRVVALGSDEGKTTNA